MKLTIPPSGYVLGFGLCSRNLPHIEHRKLIEGFLEEQGVDRDKLYGFATLKAFENSDIIAKLKDYFGKEWLFFTIEELQHYTPHIATPSAFVLKKLGIASVAEAAALAAWQGQGILYQAKIIRFPFTFALTQKETKK